MHIFHDFTLCKEECISLYHIVEHIQQEELQCLMNSHERFQNKNHITQYTKHVIKSSILYEDKYSWHI